METFSALLAICHLVTKGQWRGALIFLSAPWINDWVNNHEAGDLRRNRAHYDVIVMQFIVVESTRTTSMEDVSTGVFEKVKNI